MIRDVTVVYMPSSPEDALDLGIQLGINGYRYLGGHTPIGYHPIMCTEDIVISAEVETAIDYVFRDTPDEPIAAHISVDWEEHTVTNTRTHTRFRYKRYEDIV